MIISGTATEAWFLFNAPWMVKSADWIPGRRWEFKRRICRTTRLHWISLSLWKSVVASLMCPHLEVQKWSKCCWKWRREGSHKWNSMSDHYREELRWCWGGVGRWWWGGRWRITDLGESRFIYLWLWPASHWFDVNHISVQLRDIFIRSVSYKVNSIGDDCKWDIYHCASSMQPPFRISPQV